MFVQIEWLFPKSQEVHRLKFSVSPLGFFCNIFHSVSLMSKLCAQIQKVSTHVLWLKLYRFVYLSLSLYGTNMQSMNPREYSFPRLFFAYCFISWYVCRLSLVTIGSCKHYLLGVGVSASSCMHSPKLLRSVAEPHLCSLSLFFFFRTSACIAFCSFVYA